VTFVRRRLRRLRVLLFVGGVLVVFGVLLAV
jgi:hypothetical protein